MEYTANERALEPASAKASAIHAARKSPEIPATVWVNPPKNTMEINA